MIEVNGMAHIVLNVARWDLCKPFYKSVMGFMGLKIVHDGDEFLYCIGGRTAVGIGPCDAQHKKQRFDQGAIGLHHFCFRARSREDIDKLYEHLKELDAKIVHPPEEGPWAPGYYSVLFEDPDGIRLEVNFVPGKGVFQPGQSFNPAGDYS